MAMPDGRVFRDPEALALELETLFYPNWLCVAREAELPEPGDFLTRTIGSESLLLTRNPERSLRGFYNLCRHRGTRGAREPRGSGARSFLCPYHAWSYDTDGRLIGAPHTSGLEGFDRAQYGLHPV